MSKMKIVTVPSEILSTKAELVKDINYKTKNTLLDMLDFMVKKNGIGLAAPQVGILSRLVTIKINDEVYLMINPEIVSLSDNKDMMKEGCLSIPGETFDISRPEIVVCKYFDENGNEKKLEADGMLAKCIQHEIDHLNGITIDVKNKEQFG